MFNCGPRSRSVGDAESPRLPRSPRFCRARRLRSNWRGNCQSCSAARQPVLIGRAIIPATKSSGCLKNRTKVRLKLETIFKSFNVISGFLFYINFKAAGTSSDRFRDNILNLTDQNLVSTPSPSNNCEVEAIYKQQYTVIVLLTKSGGNT